MATTTSSTLWYLAEMRPFPVHRWLEQRFSFSAPYSWLARRARASGGWRMIWQRIQQRGRWRGSFSRRWRRSGAKNQWVTTCYQQARVPTLNAPNCLHVYSVYTSTHPRAEGRVDV